MPRRSPVRHRPAGRSRRRCGHIQHGRARARPRPVEQPVISQVDMGRGLLIGNGSLGPLNYRSSARGRICKTGYCRMPPSWVGRSALPQGGPPSTAPPPVSPPRPPRPTSTPASRRVGRLARMTIVDDQGRPEPPIAADETATLLGFLDYQRSTLAWKCAGLDAAALAATVAASAMTLGGLLKHLGLRGGAIGSPGPCTGWNSIRRSDAVDWKADPDWEWHSAAEDTPEQLRALEDAVERSRGPGRGGPGRRRPGPAGPASLARRHRAEPALDPVPHDRGVRPAQRSCRPPAGSPRRGNGGVVAASNSPLRYHFWRFTGHRPDDDH